MARWGVEEQGWAMETFSMDGGRQWESRLHTSRTACEPRLQELPF